MKFRKKPVEIEALVWNNNFDEIFHFMDADNNRGIVGVTGDVLQVRTLEGIMDAQPGDYIIKGVKGEFYPCKPDIFAMSYDVVGEPAVSAPTRDLTFGERLVGLTFNPSGDANVNKAKILCAELADLVQADYLDNKNGGDVVNVSTLKQQLYFHTVGEILNAQMNVVKLITLKY